jgi:hypothetical protein
MQQQPLPPPPYYNAAPAKPRRSKGYRVGMCMLWLVLFWPVGAYLILRDKEIRHYFLWAGLVFILLCILLGATGPGGLHWWGAAVHR